jgi:hypothetical protein
LLLLESSMSSSLNITHVQGLYVLFFDVELDTTANEEFSYR